MKLKCPLSGIQWNSEFFPESNSFEVPHPILSLPAFKVIGRNLKLFSSAELSEEETHLFGTFLLSKLPIDSWGFPLLDAAPLSSYWIPFWLRHIETLSALVLRLEGKTPKNLLSFAITEREAPLSNLDEWIRSAHISISEFYSPITPEAQKRNKEFRANLGDEQFNTEEACLKVIEKGLRGSLLSPREKDKFPELVANWAAKVGDFPNAFFRNEIGTKQTVREFWKGIIRNAFNLGNAGKGYANILTGDVSLADLEELIEHCADNIPHSTIQSKALYEQLGKLKEVIQEFRVPTSPKNLSIEVLSPEGISSFLNEVSHLPSRPKTENDDPDMPRKEDYPTLSSFLKAKIAYKGRVQTQESKETKEPEGESK